MTVDIPCASAKYTRLRSYVTSMSPTTSVLGFWKPAIALTRSYDGQSWSQDAVLMREQTWMMVIACARVIQTRNDSHIPLVEREKSRVHRKSSIDSISSCEGGDASSFLMIVQSMAEVKYKSLFAFGVSSRFHMMRAFRSC